MVTHRDKLFDEDTVGNSRIHSFHSVKTEDVLRGWAINNFQLKINCTIEEICEAAKRHNFSIYRIEELT